MGTPFPRPRHPEDQVRPMSHTFEDTTLRSMQTADSPLAFQGRNPTPDLSLLGSRTPGQPRVGKPFTNPFGSERKYKSPFADDSGCDTSGFQHLSIISDTAHLKPSPPTYGAAATPGVIQTGSVTTPLVGSQQYMIQRDHSQMTRFGQQPSAQQQALYNQQLAQQMRQQMRQQQQQQQQSGTQTWLTGNPSFHAQHWVQTKMASMPKHKQQTRQSNYQRLQAQQQRQMPAVARQRAQASAMATQRQARQARHMQLNNADSVLAENLGKMSMSSRNPFEHTQGDFRPYEVDVKTERQMFVNKVPTSRNSSISTFPARSEDRRSAFTHADQQRGDTRWASEQDDTTSTRAAGEHMGLLNVHYTLSEDRCGDQNSIMAQRLAALGARHERTVFNEHPGTFSNLGDRRLGSPADDNEEGPQWMNGLPRIPKSISRPYSFDEVDGKMEGMPPREEPPVGRLPKPALGHRKKAKAFTDLDDDQNFNLDFSTLDNTDVLENFDFDSFLNTSAADDYFLDNQIFAGLESQEPLAGW